MRKKKVPLESDIKSDIMKYLGSLPECFRYKMYGGMYSTAGVPDIPCVYRGIPVYFEAKRPQERPTKLQRNTIKEIRAAGGIAGVVYSVNEVKAVIGIVNQYYTMPETMKNEAHFWIDSPRCGMKKGPMDEGKGNDTE